MKRVAFVLGVTLLGLPAQADITHRIQSSVQLSVDGAGSVAARIPSTYAVSGSNITLDTAGGLGSLTAGSAVGYTPASYSVTTAGDAFSYSESFIEGDATPSDTTVIPSREKSKYLRPNRWPRSVTWHWRTHRASRRPVN